MIIAIIVRVMNMLFNPSAVLSQIFRFLRLVLSAGLHYMERVERPLIWCKKLPNKALAK
jgi:hypothetical protein